MVGDRCGCVVFRLGQQKITTYIPDPTNPASQTDNAVWRIEQDRDGQFWLAVQHGVVRFNP